MGALFGCLARRGKRFRRGNVPSTCRKPACWLPQLITRRASAGALVPWDHDSVKIFLSSVRRGLEEERDALPGLISAIGHTPLRFEDFSAQPLPSREACLAGVAAADVYLLILGPNYGHSFGDTGQSPTHDEWVAARAGGIPCLVYRKMGVKFEPEQEDFVRSIGDYTSGVFYDSFTATHELQTKVVGKLRELEQADSPLTFTPLQEPATMAWRADFDEQMRGHTSWETAIELHVLPVDGHSRSSRVMSELAKALPDRIRNSGLVAASDALLTTRPEGAVVVSIPSQRAGWDAPREWQLLGVRLGVDGQVSVWASLPGDGMGSILDPTELPDQIAKLLRLAGMLRVIESAQVAIGIGVDPTNGLSTARVTQLPRHSVTWLSMSDQPLRVPPDELVTVAALGVGSLEVGRLLSRALLETAGTHR